MNNLEYIANCRIVYYMGISMCLDTQLSVDSELEEMIKDYSIISFEEYHNAIKSLFCYEYENGRYAFSFPKELIELIQEKINKYDQPGEMAKIYDSVGFEKTEELTDFAVATCYYIEEVYSMGMEPTH